jgi:hypothetical protein
VGQAAAEKGGQDAAILPDLTDERVERRRERLPGCLMNYAPLNECQSL